MQDPKLILLGATALAYPLARRYGKKCLVVESGISAASEFTDAMQAVPFDPHAAYSDAANDVIASLRDHNVISEEGRLHILGAGPVLCQKYLETGCRLLTETQCLSLGREKDGRLYAEVMTRTDGRIRYHADTIIDTRVRAFMTYEKLYSLLLMGDASLSEIETDSFLILKGRFDDEFFATFRVPKTCTVPEAQKMAHQWMTENKALLKNAKVAGAASCFGASFEKPYDETRDGIRYLPSASSHNLIEAMERGAKLCLF